MINNSSNFKLAVLWVVSFFIIIFMMCFSSHASTPSTLLPFYISSDAYDTASFQTLINDQINWWGHTVFDFGSFDNILAYEYEEYGTTYIRFYGFSNSSYTISLNEPYNAFSSSGTVTLNLSSCSRYTITKVPGYYGNYSYGYDYPSNISIGFSDIENYPFVYLNGVLWTPSYNNVDGQIVFTNFATPIINTGGAILPGPFFVPDYPSGTNAPDKVPSVYNPTSYNWTTPPSFDNSSVLNALESLKDLYLWMAGNIEGAFDNLIDNIGGFFKYIGDTIQYYGNAIIDTLNNGIQTFYNNMKSLIEPIVEKFNYITEPLDLDRVESFLQSSTTYSLVSVGSSLKNTFSNYFDSITAPSTLSFHIPYNILTKSGYIDFNFGWYADIRDDVLPWIVGFLYMGFGLALFRSFPSIIHGVSGILQKGG